MNGNISICMRQWIVFNRLVLGQRNVIVITKRETNLGEVIPDASINGEGESHLRQFSRRKQIEYNQNGCETFRIKNISEDGKNSYQCNNTVESFEVNAQQRYISL